MALTAEQKSILDGADKTGVILFPWQHAACPGLHFCPDWDGMAVCLDSPEIEGCTCASIKANAEPERGAP